MATKRFITRHCNEGEVLITKPYGPASTATTHITMVASLKDIKSAYRKRSLGDIDIRSEYQNKKLKVSFSDTPPSPPQGQYPGESYHRERSRRDRYDTHYENSPLLTPKEDEPAYEIDDGEHELEMDHLNEEPRKLEQLHQNETNESFKNDDNEEDIRLNENNNQSEITPATTAPSTTCTSPRKCDTESIYADLETNPDYLSLTSTQRILTCKEQTLQKDIVRLSQMQSRLTSQSKEECVAFFMSLVENKLDLPGPAKILRAPVVDWSRYHPSLGNVARDFTSSASGCTDKNGARGSARGSSGEAMYKSLRVFEPSVHTR